MRITRPFQNRLADRMAQREPRDRCAEPVPGTAGNPILVQGRIWHSLKANSPMDGSMNKAIGNSKRVGAAISPMDQTRPMSRNTSPSASPTQGSQPVTKCQR